ncbi:hypothetical protein F8M41_010450 [Gigaspora margarita]|uniref:Uncharacterized protein n=1 Tax=Gigaspora margarita TaxID=4874 RepID=A0A8H3X0M4_GIGMA|nr:hypothetical protein F8M41_010450 [Gigaspora margarita]
MEDVMTSNESEQNTHLVEQTLPRGSNDLAQINELPQDELILAYADHQDNVITIAPLVIQMEFSVKAATSTYLLENDNFIPVFYKHPASNKR